eukprot:1296291-Amphidinium_carterae.1
MAKYLLSILEKMAPTQAPMKIMGPSGPATKPEETAAVTWQDSPNESVSATNPENPNIAPLELETSTIKRKLT